MSLHEISGSAKPRPAEGARPHIVIIGGGLSGAALAFHLALESGEAGPRITVIEPRAALGQGLAYSTRDPDHRLNVPDYRMTLETAYPESYADWLRSEGAPQPLPDAVAPSGDIFTPRASFAAYVAAKLAPFLASRRITHLRDRAIAAGAETSGAGAGGFTITTETGTRLFADRLILAATHPAPAIPRELAALQGSLALIPDAYREEALAEIAPDERLVIIGTGLTGADIAATLSRRGHAGQVTLISRHGRRSQPHGPVQPETGEDFASSPAGTARALLRRIREALARDEARGLTWHPIFDRLRVQGPQIWAALPLTERRRLLRHLRGLWDIHRFRIAPQTHATLEAGLASGRFSLIAGRLRRVSRGETGLTLTLGHAGGKVTELQADRIILATGPAHGAATRLNPLYADLARQGRLRVDPLGLGLDTTPDGAALDASGRADPRLLVAGPLARASVGELMGVPEVTAWAEKLARHLTAEALTPETRTRSG